MHTIVDGGLISIVTLHTDCSILLITQATQYDGWGSKDGDRKCRQNIRRNNQWLQCMQLHVDHNMSLVWRYTEYSSNIRELQQ